MPYTQIHFISKWDPSNIYVCVLLMKLQSTGVCYYNARTLSQVFTVNDRAGFAYKLWSLYPKAGDSVRFSLSSTFIPQFRLKILRTHSNGYHSSHQYMTASDFRYHQLSYHNSAWKYYVPIQMATTVPINTDAADYKTHDTNDYLDGTQTDRVVCVVWRHKVWVVLLVVTFLPTPRHRESPIQDARKCKKSYMGISCRVKGSNRINLLRYELFKKCLAFMRM